MAMNISGADAHTMTIATNAITTTAGVFVYFHPHEHTTKFGVTGHRAVGQNKSVGDRTKWRGSTAPMGHALGCVA